MAERGPSVKTYLSIFIALVVLTMVTYNVAQQDLGIMTVPVALGIAIFKASLVVVVFMHVRYSERLVWIFVGGGVAGLVLLIVGTLHDYWSRGWLGQ
jgi:cytochrome c oxidase subunit 4